MSDDDPNIPTRLADDLRDVADARIFVPSGRDDAILAEARRRLASNTSEAATPTRFRFVPWTGAAAAVLVAGVLLWTMTNEPSFGPSAPQRADHASEATSSPSTTAIAREDLDASGTVDIVDALLLARSIDTETPPTREYDYTGDGIVDTADVDHLARRAVALHTPGGAG